MERLKLEAEKVKIEAEKARLEEEKRRAAQEQAVKQQQLQMQQQQLAQQQAMAQQQQQLAAQQQQAAALQQIAAVQAQAAMVAAAQAHHHGFDPVLAHGHKVIIESVASKHSLRSHPDGKVDGMGGQGELAIWEVRHDGNMIRLFHPKTGKFLRVEPSGHLDCNGGQGPLTLLVPEVKSPGVFNFKSHAGHGYVGILHDGQPKNGKETGKGDHGSFRVMPLGGQVPVVVASAPAPAVVPHVVVVATPQQGKQHKFSSLTNGSRVHLKTASGKNLRVDDHGGGLNGNGGEGKFATWTVHREGTHHVRFQSCHGKYLRIHPTGVADADGGTGELSLFEIEKSAKATFNFKSKHGYLGVLQDGHMKNANQTGKGVNGTFQVLRAR
jgi:hypothetical protein